MKEGYVIAFDQALANTGYAVGFLKDNSIEVVKFGIHKTPSTQTEQERLLSIEDLTASLVEEYSPIRVYTESVFLRKSTPNQGKVLVKVEATVHNFLANSQIPYVVVNANRARKSWRSQLQISKEEGGKAATKRRLNVDGLTEHSADAVAILLTGLINENLITLDCVNQHLNEPKLESVA